MRRSSPHICVSECVPFVCRGSVTHGAGSAHGVAVGARMPRDRPAGAASAGPVGLLSATCGGKQPKTTLFSPSREWREVPLPSPQLVSVASGARGKFVVCVNPLPQACRAGANQQVKRIDVNGTRTRDNVMGDQCAVFLPFPCCCRGRAHTTACGIAIAWQGGDVADLSDLRLARRDTPHGSGPHRGPGRNGTRCGHPASSLRGLCGGDGSDVSPSGAPGRRPPALPRPPARSARPSPPTRKPPAPGPSPRAGSPGPPRAHRHRQRRIRVKRRFPGSVTATSTGLLLSPAADVLFSAFDADGVPGFSRARPGVLSAVTGIEMRPAFLAPDCGPRAASPSARAPVRAPLRGVRTDYQPGVHLSENSASTVGPSGRRAALARRSRRGRQARNGRSPFGAHV